VRFPLRRQQQVELAGAAAAAPGPIPFPPQPGANAPDGAAGTWEELLNRAAPEIPLRGQMTGSDARAERLVRQVRSDVERLQKVLDALGQEQGELVEADPAAIAANPDAAATLAPGLLVRAVIAAETENRRLRKRLAKARQREQKLQGRLQQMELASAARKSRLDTIEEVLAALHGNLQDLRQEREFLRQWAPAQVSARPELPPGGESR
jgi:chromosome segregation ATPase